MSFVYINENNQLQKSTDLSIDGLITKGSTILNGYVNIKNTLDIDGTVNIKKNLIIPKSTTSVSTSEIGSIYYNSTSNNFMGKYNDGWKNLGSGSSGGSSINTSDDATFSKNNDRPVCSWWDLM